MFFLCFFLGGEGVLFFYFVFNNYLRGLLHNLIAVIRNPERKNIKLQNFLPVNHIWSQQGKKFTMLDYSFSSFFHGIQYKQSQLPFKFNVCLSISHGIITNMYDVFHMFFPTKFMNVFQFIHSNFLCVL